MLYKFIGFILFLVVIHAIIKARNGGNDPIFGTVNKNDYLEGDNELEYDDTETIKELEGNLIQKTLSKVLINVIKTEQGRLIFEKMLRPMYHNLNDTNFSIKINEKNIIDKIFNVKTINEGKGRPAVCGEAVKIKYKVLNMQNLVLESGTKNLRLGQGNIFNGADNVIVGMKIGETRTALIPKEYAYDSMDYNRKKPLNATSEYKFDVTLESKLSNIRIENIKIFDDTHSFLLPWLCADRVSFDTNITDIKGNVLFNTTDYKKKIKLRIGDMKHPIIFTYGLYNKPKDGIRTAIFKGKYLNNFAGEKYDKIPLSKPIDPEEFYIIEFSNVTTDY